MPFEINDGRTPPTVLLSMSQSTPGGLEYERNSTTPIPHGRNRTIIHKNVEQFKDVSNLKVNYRNRRSFTPVKNSLFLKSPELSPIDTAANSQHGYPENARYSSPNLEQSLTPGDYKVLEQSLTPVEFKVPPLLYKTNEGETPIRPHHFHKQNRPHKSSEIQLEDLNQTQSLDKSASHGYLNHKLEVRLILKNAGMQQYTEAFEKEKMDFGKFLSLCEEDLLRLGVERKVDRKVIFNIISDLNAN
ncbi:uncharacterized protein LOC129942326 [Eupeodes corollae]|uniref:uncharacterized protein LOC129942326 n=1 Tax=Eupeodes corollae TaxID=290404 RepID=UPI002492F864|nr:uncharacterized protein LOC129942326 [Eupeodes corollae]